MRTIGICLAVVGLAVACSAFADAGMHNRYKWRDGQGNLHFDDALPIEALQFGYDIVNPQGLTIQHVERVRTAEEQKSDRVAADKAAAEQLVADEQAKTDQQTLAAYPNEHELVSSQQAQLDMLDQNINATQLSLQNQEKSLTEMLSHAADLDRTGKPIPDALKSQIEALRKNVEHQKTYITSKQQQKADDTKRFETELAHYRQIQAKAQAQH